MCVFFTEKDAITHITSLEEPAIPNKQEVLEQSLYIKRWSINMDKRSGGR